MSIEVISELFMPKIMTKIIQNGVPNGDYIYIGKLISLMVLLSVLGILGGVGCLIVASSVSQRAGTDLRRDLFMKIQGFSFFNIDQFQTSSLITRLTNDITQIQRIIQMALRLLIRAPLLSVGSIIMAVSINAKLTLVFVMAAPIVILAMVFIICKGFPLFRLVQKKLDEVNRVMRENLSGVRVVKSFVRSDYEKEKFKKVNEDYRNTTMKAFRITVMMSPIMMLVLNLTIVAILWFGGIQVKSGTARPEEIIAFITYLMQIMMALMMLGMVFMIFSRSKVSIDRVEEVMQTEADIKGPAHPILPPTSMGKVEYRNVSFRYAGGRGDPVLEHISFTAKPGQTVAILGETGAGKSTLVNLMPRLYDVSEGEIQIDGVNIKDYELKELRNRVSVVLQEVILFSGTILENIRWGNPDATEEEIIEATKAAQAHEFIMGLPNQYDTKLGQKGINLSGGQKQRISIARALIKKPSILIFDDSTSAVDMATEKKIQKTMEQMEYKCTKFLIAQRISSVKHADKILVLKGGRIVAEGDHNYLMETSEEYQNIYASQMGKGAVIHE